MILKKKIVHGFLVERQYYLKNIFTFLMIKYYSLKFAYQSRTLLLSIPIGKYKNRSWAVFTIRVVHELYNYLKIIWAECSDKLS